MAWYGMVWYGMVDVHDGYLAAEVSEVPINDLFNGKCCA